MFDPYFSSQQYILRLLGHNALVVPQPLLCDPSFCLHLIMNSPTLATAQDADVMIDECYMRHAMECG